MVFLNGRAIRETDARGGAIRDDSFLVLFNAHYEPIDFVIPERSYGEEWFVEIDTAGGEVVQATGGVTAGVTSTATPAATAGASAGASAGATAGATAGTTAAASAGAATGGSAGAASVGTPNHVEPGATVTVQARSIVVLGCPLSDDD